MTQEQNTETVTLSLENVKELFRKMFKEQQEALLKILSCCTDTLNQRLDKLTLQITDNNSTLKECCKETDDLKLSLDASLNIYDDKLNKLKKTKEFEKEHRTYLEKVWQDNHELREKLGDLEERRENIRIDELDE